jgi:hypothetical protein
MHENSVKNPGYELFDHLYQWNTAISKTSFSSFESAARTEAIFETGVGEDQSEKANEIRECWVVEGSFLIGASRVITSRY